MISKRSIIILKLKKYGFSICPTVIFDSVNCTMPLDKFMVMWKVIS